MATRTPAPALDLSSLTVEAAELPKAQRERKVRDNPFVAALGESYEADEGRQVVVPHQNVRQVIYLIRQAANDLNIGARIVVQNRKGETVEQKKEGLNSLRGQVTVLFAGKDRKQRKDEGDEPDEAEEAE